MTDSNITSKPPEAQSRPFDTACKSVEPRPLDTACDGCIFAKYDDITQIGCEFNLVEKYRKHGVNVLEVFDEEGKEYFVLRDKICLYKRHQGWGKKFPKRRKQQILKEIQVQYQVFLFLNEGDSLSDIEYTIQQLSEQSIPPKHVTVISKPTSLCFPSDIVNMLRKYDLWWRLENVHDIALSDEECIDLIIKVCSFPFFAIFHGKCDIPKNFFEKFNHMVTKEFHPFLAVSPNSKGQGTIIPFHSYFYYRVRGEKGQDTLTKISRKKKWQKLIIPVHQICPNFLK